MIPNNKLSFIPVPSDFVEQVNSRHEPLIDYEMGGVAVGDATQGLMVKLWRVDVVGDDVLLSADNSPAITLFSRPNITEVSLAFDQAMNPVVAFVEDGVAWLWWFDTSVNKMVFTSYPGVTNPRVTLDEKRLSQVASSDVIFAYIKSGGLYFRMQRDRYLTEYLLKADVNARLISMGINKGGRLQFQLLPALDS